jgi:transposase
MEYIGIDVHKRESQEHLRAWAQGVAAWGGKRKAVVALARKLAGILWAMMRDGTEYWQPRQ